MTDYKLKFENLSDDDWFKVLLSSVDNRSVQGVQMPRFPDEFVQSQFVGSSNVQALKEGFEFYKLVKGYAEALGMPLSKKGCRFLDFGCGWGRYLRFFCKDIQVENLFGVDIDPDILKSCDELDVPGVLTRIFPDGNLPYPDNYFDCVIAYSVFTHLPESVHLHWVKEIERVSTSGSIFVLTLESARFLDFVESLLNTTPQTGWHAGLQRFSGKVDEYRNTFLNGGFVYLPSGGGDYRPADVYGDAVVPLEFIRREWPTNLTIKDYIDGRFWQAVLVAQKS